MSLNAGTAFSQGHCEEEGQQRCQSNPALVRDSKVHPLSGVVYILPGKGTKPEILWNATKIFVYETWLKNADFFSKLLLMEPYISKDAELENVPSLCEGITSFDLREIATWIER